jgi:hypothetical protein
MAVLLALIGASPAQAIYLDKDRDIALRARIYSQASIRIEDSNIDTVPVTKSGQLVQHRNFYNPELDARLTSYTKWMKGAGLGWIAPDDFSFRVAAWGFYDGIYDYGSSQFDRARRKVNGNYPTTAGTNAFFLRGEDFSCPKGFNADTSPCVNAEGRPFNSLEEVFPGHDLQEPRDIFSSQERINELYLSYSKGPAFLRIGRQAISWGEADTIALLDQNNPFDVTAGPPGAFLDLEEARIPLWTVRASYNVFDNIGPFASGSLEGYWVPGWIDTNTGIIPPLTASPYSPVGKDPQQTIIDLVEMQIGGVTNHQFVLLDSQPDRNFSNSRYGFRFQTVIARDHTFSTWFYTHFPSMPAARSLGSVRINPQSPTDKRFLFVTETVHKLTSVYGVADSFFFEPLDSIIRAEVEFFENEPGFIPEKNLGAGPGGDSAGLAVLFHKGSVPVQDMLRWELGLDRFFFIRPLNPANAFLVSAAVVGAYNLDETDQKDFYAIGQRKPGKLGDSTDDFVDLKPVEAFLNVHLENQWRHGKLFFGFTGIAHSRATFAAMPEVRYRFSDSLLFSAKVVWIGGNFQSIGQFKDRDQISLRATYQLN